MYKIRTYNAISSKGLSRFPADSYQVSSESSDPDGILLRSQKMHTEVLPESLVAIARAGAGTNNIPVADYTEKGVVVFNTPGANANAVKELIVAALLMGSRDIYGGMNYVQGLTEITDSGEMSKLLEKEKKNFAGGEIQGKTLGVVGLGAIGSMIGNLALELGMNVVGYDPAISVEAAWQLSSSVERMENLEALLACSDFITLHVPAIPATKHLINSKTLAGMKSTAKILNFAREEIVSSADMVAALDAGVIAGYITDFPAPELLGRKDVLLMPHIGASTEEAEENCAVMAANQLMDFLENGNILNSVNYPKIRMSRNGGTRITFTNKNVPKVLGSVLSILADGEINVVDMVNKSRDEIAYNIIDIEGDLNDSLKAQIVAVDGVVHVRVI
ncbi:phosphoglycerate dehydrogenase [Porticoccaceae bacterium]|nr:phosphoglycerate dehydrogenase [Porticoccaceae bacterium]MDB9706299.1 phosphoglycerate dehydrogenase [Porticoccaceae bacterium]MDB9736713.1 phosphoglycerate dehydrogenase [Porticoccaceae bacterium]MDB9804570.1 phosphoglycerate dehydrogenase [Porticoccaceae bacterium]